MTTLPTRAAETAVGSAYDLDTIAARAAGFARQARAANTVRAYEADWRDFAGWCAGHDLTAVPADPVTVALLPQQVLVRARDRECSGRSNGVRKRMG